MMENSSLYLYNTLTRAKELFQPQTPPHVGMYVCGPTVYGDAHLGHARPAVTYDILFRYLSYLGYQVRYVRNITDVGHLEDDSDDGEDKIAKKARLEKLEPMEVVQYYTLRYHKNMEQLNTLPPSIEPRATGHIIEQIEIIEQILNNGFAYEVNGSVYFDVEKYNQSTRYGILSGRVVEDLLANTRQLDGQEDKKSSLDFALWKKASPEHIMKWSSPWGVGFPGWHLECSAMSRKYLGDHFDIHGGGMDLLFPHHECEIAQGQASCGHTPAKYWVHNNMITINGQKMGKSLGNFITLDEIFSGNHKLLNKAHNPMAIRFFMLQAHYRSTLDFSNEALEAAEKGLQRLIASYHKLQTLSPADNNDFDVESFKCKCFEALNDDLNTPILIAHLFDAIKFINKAAEGNASISLESLTELKMLFEDFLVHILGLKTDIEEAQAQSGGLDGELMNLLIQLRTEAKQEKNFALADKIRNELSSLNVELKDTKDGVEWSIKK
jgi:cysteinyl-tRNA synthetase